MKRLFCLFALAASCLASADSVGAYVGTDVGVQYQRGLTQNTALRYGLNLDSLFNRGSLGIGGEIVYLINRNNKAFSNLAPYYGFGLGASIALGDNTGIAAYPHAVGGLGYKFSGNMPIDLFLEGNFGTSVNVSTGNLGLDLTGGVRLGVNYRLK